MEMDFITFATGSPLMRATGDRIAKQAIKSRYFDTVEVLSPDLIQAVVPPNVRRLWQPTCRGYGYWTWKPWAVFDRLIRLPKSSKGLWYVDAGCTISRSDSARQRMSRYLETLQNDSWGLAFQLDSHFPEFAFTKSAAREFFGFDADRDRTGQVQATAFFVRNNEPGLALIREWAVLTEHTWLFDDSIGERDLEFVGQFIDHRHDQSIFSLLAKRSRGSLVRDELHNFEILENRVQLSQTSPWPINATRIRSRFDSTGMSPFRRAIRLSEKMIGGRPD